MEWGLPFETKTRSRRGHVFSLSTVFSLPLSSTEVVTNDVIIYISVLGDVFDDQEYEKCLEYRPKVLLDVDVVRNKRWMKQQRLLSLQKMLSDKALITTALSLAVFIVLRLTFVCEEGSKKLHD